MEISGEVLKAVPPAGLCEKLEQELARSTARRSASIANHVSPGAAANTPPPSHDTTLPKTASGIRTDSAVVKRIEAAVPVQEVCKSISCARPSVAIPWAPLQPASEPLSSISAIPASLCTSLPGTSLPVFHGKPPESSSRRKCRITQHQELGRTAIALSPALSRRTLSCRGPAASSSSRPSARLHRSSSFANFSRNRTIQPRNLSQSHILPCEEEDIHIDMEVDDADAGCGLRSKSFDQDFCASENHYCCCPSPSSSSSTPGSLR